MEEKNSEENTRLSQKQLQIYPYFQNVITRFIIWTENITLL